MLKCHFPRLRTWGKCNDCSNCYTSIYDCWWLANLQKSVPPKWNVSSHFQYCMGTVVLDKPSILRMSQCLVNGPCQSSLNKAITSSPWSEVAVNDRRHESIAPYHQTGFTVGIVDSTFIHHPRGHPIYGVYKYFDVEDRYTFAIQLVTRASRRKSFSSLDRQWTPFVSSLKGFAIVWLEYCMKAKTRWPTPLTLVNVEFDIRMLGAQADLYGVTGVFAALRPLLSCRLVVW